MMDIGEIFEFLKPNRWNVVLTGLLVLGVYIVWNYVLPGTNYLNMLRLPAEQLDVIGIKLLLRLIALIVAGLIVIMYTLISLIVYFAKGGFRDE